jgi:hypothetical protein
VLATPGETPRDEDAEFLPLLLFKYDGLMGLVDCALGLALALDATYGLGETERFAVGAAGLDAEAGVGAGAGAAARAGAGAGAGAGLGAGCACGLL